MQGVSNKYCLLSNKHCLLTFFHLGLSAELHLYAIILFGNANFVLISVQNCTSLFQRFHIFYRIIHCTIKRLCTFDSLSCFSEVSMWLRDSDNGCLLDHRGASYCCDVVNPSLHVPYSWTAVRKRGIPTVFQRKL